MFKKRRKTKFPIIAMVIAVLLAVILPAAAGATPTTTAGLSPAVDSAATAATKPDPAMPFIVNPPQCKDGADYGWFCAYSGEYYTGESRGSYDCVNLYIPWFSTGSWDNNQTPGTRPILHWVDSSRPPWTMQPAPYRQLYGVDWSPVNYIDIC